MNFTSTMPADPGSPRSGEPNNAPISGLFGAAPSKESNRASPNLFRHSVWSKLRGSVTESDAPRDFLRLIKRSGETVSLSYSDIAYVKLPEKGRMYLVMHNEDVWDIYGRDLQRCLGALEDRLILALAESHPGEATTGEPWIESIQSMVFKVPPSAMKKVGSTPVLAPFANRGYETAL
jgi:hypothetical protein